MEICIVADTKNDKNQQPAEEIRGTTLLLEMEYADESIGSSGTAFFVADDKIATNCHLLLEATTVIAKHIEADVIYAVEGIMAFDTENDLVILKVSDEGTSFQLSDSDRAQPGEPIYVLGYPGYPEEEARSKAEGTLLGFLNRGKRIWFKAPIRPGYSGGPMLNSKGEVIAVHHGSKNRSGDEGLAIPSNTLKALLTEAQGAKVEPLSTWQKRRDVLIITVYKLYGGGTWLKRAIVMLRLAWHVIKGFCYAIRANIKTDAEDYARVIAIYDKIIAGKLVPFLGAAYAYRGMAKSEFGNYQDAIEDADEAITLEPKSYNGYYSRGYVNQALGKSKADQGDITEAEKIISSGNKRLR